MISYFPIPNWKMYKALILVLLFGVFVGARNVIPPRGYHSEEHLSHDTTKHLSHDTTKHLSHDTTKHLSHDTTEDFHTQPVVSCESLREGPSMMEIVVYFSCIYLVIIAWIELLRKCGFD